MLSNSCQKDLSFNYPTNLNLLQSKNYKGYMWSIKKKKKTHELTSWRNRNVAKHSQPVAIHEQLYEWVCGWYILDCHVAKNLIHSTAKFTVTPAESPLSDQPVATTWILHILGFQLKVRNNVLRAFYTCNKKKATRKYAEGFFSSPENLNKSLKPSSCSN